MSEILLETAHIALGAAAGSEQANPSPSGSVYELENEVSCGSLRRSRNTVCTALAVKTSTRALTNGTGPHRDGSGVVHSLHGRRPASTTAVPCTNHAPCMHCGAATAWAAGRRC